MLYYKKILNANSKEWCVFIHGAGGSSSIWHKQVKSYSENFNLLLRKWPREELLIRMILFLMIHSSFHRLNLLKI
jgi:hypothetical protein